MNPITDSDNPNLVWTINCFSSLKTGILSKENVLVHHNIEWNLLLYPYDTRYNTFISIFLEIKTQHKVHAVFKYTLEDKNGKHLKSLQTDHTFYETENSLTPWGFQEFIERDEITPLVDDTLIVKCWINIPTPEESFCIDYNDLKLMVDNLKKLLISENLSDVILETNDGNEFPAHKCLLAAQSPVFKGMFNHNMKENQENRVTIEDIDSVTLKALLEFIYTSKFNKKQPNLEKLFVASDKYQIDILKTKCEKELCQQMTAEKAVDYLILADDHQAENLKIKALDCIKANLEIIVEKNVLEKKLKTKPILLTEIITYLSKYIKKN